jgi:hypothetical protein
MTEIDLSRAVWRTSRRSQQNGACVEVATHFPGVVAVRDSKDPDGAKLIFASAHWQHFLHELKTGRSETT